MDETSLLIGRSLAIIFTPFFWAISIYLKTLSAFLLQKETSLKYIEYFGNHLFAYKYALEKGWMASKYEIYTHMSESILAVKESVSGSRNTVDVVVKLCNEKGGSQGNLYTANQSRTAEEIK